MKIRKGDTIENLHTGRQFTITDMVVLDGITKYELDHGLLMPETQLVHWRLVTPRQPNHQTPSDHNTQPA